MPTAAPASSAPRRLIALPLATSVAIAWQSLRVRFFRSLITTISLVLAVSFLSFVQVNNDIAAGLMATGDHNMRQALVRAGYDLPAAGEATGEHHLSAKQRWLVILSLLVCAVGIINAQLMAVTERFREIGTMKCLGALDRFIVRLFLLEAAMQGLAGALAGAVTGALFALAGSALRFGLPALGAAPWRAILLSIGGATAIGCLLSLAGVVYPAIMAARMQPVDAMRTEQ